MSQHLQYGILLYQQDRYAQAEQELRLAVAEDPGDPIPHAFLAACLAAQGQLDPAEAEAREAVRTGPDEPFAHAVLAEVFFKRNRPAEAERAARESLRLNPLDAGKHGLLAGILHDRGNWRGALRAAEEGLSHQPDHAGCAAVRTMALLKLGRTAEAAAVAADTLRDRPDDALAHCARGWALLEDRRPSEALTFFREALRIDPSLEWARSGLIEALKARYWLYRQMLGFFLWMGRLSPAARWGVVIGLFLLQQALGTIADKAPGARPLVLPVLFTLVGFVLLSWLAGPLFNLLLRLNRFGRYALSPDQRRQSHWVAGLIVLGLAALLLWAVSDLLLMVFAFFTALTCLFLLVPVSSVFTVPRGWPRWVMAAYAGGMVIVWIVMSYWLLDAEWKFDAGRNAAGAHSVRTARAVFDVNFWAALGGGILANVLGSVRVRR
jgi:tetratricopeptide (TPR) repeat protein